MPAPATAPGFRPATWLRYGVSLGILAWVAAQLGSAGLAGLAALDWHLAVPALALAGLAYPLQAWRWQRLLRAQEITLPAARIHALFWIGNFYNSFLPGGIAGDAVRLLATWREQPGRRAAAAASLVADRLLGLGALLVLAILALAGQLAGGAHAQLETLLYTAAAALAVLAAGTIIVVQTRAWQGLAVRLLGTERADALRRTADALRHDPPALLAASALSVAVWILDFAALWLLARACGLPAGPLPLGVAAAGAYLAAALPISIGGHGVREGALVVLLGWLGLGAGQPATVATLALSFWLVNTVWSAAGGLVALVASPAAPAASSPPPQK